MINQEDYVVEGIPITEYFKNDTPIKNVMFFIHGHGSNKQFGVGRFPEKIAQEGILVVTLDAFKHGLRIEEPYISGNGKKMAIAMIEVIERTTQDILRLFETRYEHRFSNYHVLGISMGGHIAFQSARASEKSSILIPIIGSPDLKGHYIASKKDLLGDDLFKIIPDLEKLDLMESLDVFIGKKLFILNGSKDQIVLDRFSIKLREELAKANHPDVIYRSYECGHEVTEEMEEDIISYLRAKI